MHGRELQRQVSSPDGAGDPRSASGGRGSRAAEAELLAVARRTCTALNRLVPRPKLLRGSRARAAARAETPMRAPQRPHRAAARLRARSAGDHGARPHDGAGQARGPRQALHPRGAGRAARARSSPSRPRCYREARDAGAVGRPRRAPAGAGAHCSRRWPSKRRP